MIFWQIQCMVVNHLHTELILENIKNIFAFSIFSKYLKIACGSDSCSRKMIKTAPFQVVNIMADDLDLQGTKPSAAKIVT